MITYDLKNQRWINAPDAPREQSSSDARRQMGVAMGRRAANQYGGPYGHAANSFYNEEQNPNRSDMENTTRGEQRAALEFTGPYAPIFKMADNRARSWKATSGTMDRIDRLDQHTNPGTWLLNGAMGGGGKDADQMQRDAVRGALENAGFSHDYNVPLADGSSFNIGGDGGAKLQNSGENIDGNTDRHPYDIDFSNQLAKDSLPQVLQMANQMLGQGADQKQVSDLSGMLSNAVTSNAKTMDDVKANLASLSKQHPQFNTPQDQ